MAQTALKPWEKDWSPKSSNLKPWEKDWSSKESVRPTPFGVPEALDADHPALNKVATEPEQDDRYQGSLKQNISSSMYDGMQHEDALKLYGELTKGGSRVFKDKDSGQNVAIPKPGIDLIGSAAATAGNVVDVITRSRKEDDGPVLEFLADTDGIDKAAGVVGNSIRSAGSGFLAVRDALSGENDVEQFEKDWPVYPMQGVDKTVSEIAPIVFGGYGGAQVAIKYAPEAIKKSSGLAASVARYFTAGAGAAVGEAVLAPSDSTTGIVGESAAIPILQGVDLSDESRAAEIIEGRLNILMDALVLGGAIDAGAKSSGLALGLLNDAVVKPLRNFGASEAVIEENALTPLINQIAFLENINDPAERAALVRKLAEGVRANGSEIIRIGEEGIEDIAVNRTSISALEEAIRDGNYKNVDALITRMREFGKEQGQAGGVNYQNAIVDAERTLERFNETIAARDGLNNPNIYREGMENIQEQAKSIVDTAKKYAGDKEAQLKRETTDIQTLLKDDPMFGESLDKAGKAVGFDTARIADETQDVASDRLTRLFIKMRNQKDYLYDQIPEDAYIDDGLIEEIVDSLDGQFDPDVVKIIEESEGNYKKLYNNLVPKLRGRTNSLYKAERPDYAKIAAYERIVKFVNEDSLEYLIEGSDEEIASIVGTARDYYRDQYAMWENGALKDFAHGVRLSNDLADETGVAKRLYPEVGEEQSRKALEKALSPTEPERTRSVLRAMGNEVYEGSTQDVVDYIIGKTSSRILRDINASSSRELSGETLKGAVSELEAYGKTLREQFPEEYDRINKFVTNIQQKDINVDRLRTELKGATEQADKIEDQVYNGALADFFRKEGSGEFVPSGNATLTFQNIIKDKEGLSKIKRIMDTVEVGSTAHSAMKKAYLDHFDNVVRTAQENVAGTRSMKAQKVKDILDGRDQIFEIGNLIYKDSPQIPYAHSRLLGLSHEASMRAKAKGPAGAYNQNPNDAAKGAKTSMDGIITMIFGPLSRAGARVRAVSSRAVNALDRADRIKMIQDELYADPEAFATVLDRLAKAEARGADVNMTRKVMFDFLVKSGIYGTEDKEYIMEVMDALEDNPEFDVDAAVDPSVDTAPNNADSEMEELGIDQ